jgi:hypothetical protein
MKYVPSLPPPIVGAVDRYESRPLPRTQATHPVQQRSVPPLIFQHRRREPVRNAGAVAVERRHDPHVDGERRTYCRRSVHQPVLLELRSGIERRHHAQRSTDLTDHIDEEA